MMASIQPVSWLDLLWVGLLLGISGLISLILKLRLESKLAVASLRTIVQLTLLGFVLEWIFEIQRWYLVLALLGTMTILASFHALRRSSWIYRGSYIVSLIALSIGTIVTAVIVTRVILNVQPWYNPQYLIPLVGMILGNGMTGISLGVDRFLSSLKEEKNRLEGRLYLGATAWEAALPMIRTAIYHGHIPILNSMTIAGIISLPGMMTGQILSGVDPALAVRYQIIVMFMITSACSIGTMIFILMSVRRLFTRWHQLDEAAIRRH